MPIEEEDECNEDSGIRKNIAVAPQHVLAILELSHQPLFPPHVAPQNLVAI